MQIHNLQNTSIEQITHCFNQAFEGYFVPLKMSTEQLSNKIKSENIILEYSVGVTIDSQLAGFILIGIDEEKKIAYNAGTGVIKDCRGQKLTGKMYTQLFSNLAKLGIRHHLLEVICENEKALKIYEELGYFVLRKVICYKGLVQKVTASDYKINAIELPTETKVKLFWNQFPTYQNSLFCIRNNAEKHPAFGAFDNGKLIGYIIFDKDTLRVKQFGINPDFRHEGVGHQLFYKVQNLIPDKEVSLINCDEDDTETNDFLSGIGLQPFISQYEMKLKSY